MTILSIDPGKRIGYALFTDKGEDIERGVIQFDDWFNSTRNRLGIDYSGWACFDERIVDQVVVEGFRHDPTVAQGGSVHWASQIEGAVKMLGALTGVPVAVQYSNILSVAMIHDGYEKPKTKTGKDKHLPDEDSAWLHGRYFLRSQGVLQ